jgi:hypothetical protein
LDPEPTVLVDAQTQVDGEHLGAGLIFALENGESAQTALPVAALVEEVNGWVTSARDQSWKGRSGEGNRDSLVSEIEASENAVGPSLRAHLGDTLTDYDAVARRILASGSRHDEDVALLISAATALNERLSSPSGLRATWADARAAVEASDLFSAIGAVGQLEGQVSLAGRDAKQALGGVLQILRRDPRALKAARRLGDVEAEPARDTEDDPAVRLPSDKVLNLAARYLVEPGRTGHVVVWTLYDHADTSQGRTELGPLTIFMPQWIIAVAFDNEEATWHPLEEVRRLWHAEYAHKNGHDYAMHVLVRIDLGIRNTVGALDAAADLIRTLMDAVISAGAGGRWGKARWSTLLVDGEEWASRSSRGSKRPTFDDTFGMGAVAHALEEGTERYPRALMERPVPPHLREALRICAEASHAESRAVSLYGEWRNDERTVLLLLDSAFEHVVALGQTRSKALSDRISRLWPEASRTDQIIWAIDSCLNAGNMLRRRPDESAALEREIRKTSKYGQTTQVLSAYQALDRLLVLTASPLQAAVVQRTLGQLGDPGLYAAETDRLKRNADLVVDRQRRVRNSITHGNPVTRYVLGTVVEFSRFRTGMALRAALDSFSEGFALEDYLLSKEEERDEDGKLMRAGMSQVDIWLARESGDAQGSQ